MIYDVTLARRFYGADAHLRHLWLRVHGKIDYEWTNQTMAEVESNITAFGLTVRDRHELKVLTAGLRVMGLTHRMDAGVSFEIGKKVRLAMNTLRENLPELIALEQVLLDVRPDWSRAGITRYRLMLRLIDWFMKWTFLGALDNLKRPQGLWHTDAKWLACALNQTCALPGEPLSFSAQGARVYESKAAKLLKDMVPNCPAHIVGTISNSLAAHNGATLKPYEIYGEKAKYPLHAHGWKARIASTFLHNDE